MIYCYRPGMIFICLFACLQLLNQIIVVQGAQCKTSFGALKCSPCGKGSRCNFCEWCTGYCRKADSNSARAEEKETNIPEYGSEEAPYKTPFLDIFRDLERLINGGLIADLDVVNIYRSISETTREDCDLCNQQPDLDRLSNFTFKVSEILRPLVGKEEFKTNAINKTVTTYSEVNDLPYSIKIMVEKDSSILQSVQRAVLISGGVGTDQHSAEIFYPENNTSCSLPKLPRRRFYSTQSGDHLCGGGPDSDADSTRGDCVKWSNGTWNKSHTLQQKRYGHSSWATALGTYLIGGTHSPKTSELILDGRVEKGFDLKYDARWACAIPDPINEEVIITGGTPGVWGQGEIKNTTAVYNKDGWIKDLASLNQARYLHGCTSFIQEGQRVLMVMGGSLANGDILESTEIFSNNVWSIVPTARVKVTRVLNSVLTIHNRVFIFGGWSKYVCNSILEYNQESKTWAEIGTMEETRYGAALSPVNFENYKIFCQ